MIKQSMTKNIIQPMMSVVEIQSQPLTWFAMHNMRSSKVKVEMLPTSLQWLLNPNVKVQNIESISLNKSTKMLTYHSEN